MDKRYDFTQAWAEADRCLLCHDAPCSKGCPANTDPGKFIKKFKIRKSLDFDFDFFNSVFQKTYYILCSKRHKEARRQSCQE